MEMQTDKATDSRGANTNLGRFDEWRQAALSARRHVIRTAARGGSFVGASLSCVETLTVLYRSVMDVSPKGTEDRERDYFFLSKGHAVPALYAVMAEAGFLDAKRLDAHLRSSDCIYWHPNRDVNGVEFHFGSLGHGLPVGLGVAMEQGLSKAKGRTFVMVGDGELNEGSVWEAIMVAGSQRVGKLVMVIDRNHLQANIETEKLVPLEPLGDKFESFGWDVRHAHGHDFSSLEGAFAGCGQVGKPVVVIADTVRGKGVPSIERRTDRWFMKVDEETVQSLLNELEEQASSEGNR